MTNVLLVQPDAILAELISLRLEVLGCRVDVVANSGEAWASINQSIPDLIVADTALPDVDTAEWILWLRVPFPPKRLPILVFSVDPADEAIARSMDAGASDWLKPPLHPDEVAEKLEIALSSRVVCLRRL